MTKLLTLLPENANNLREKIDPTTVDGLGGSLKELSDRLHATRAAYNAVGLAANQVGLNVRMFVMSHAGMDYTCINPEIIEKSEIKVKGREGCLSFPNLFLSIERPAEIKVKYLDLDLEEKEVTLKGILAKCFQHELDHLDGIVMTSHVSKLVLAMGRKKQAKAKRFR